MTVSLNKARLAEATAALCERDSDLAKVVEEFGVPPLWKRPQGFRTLLYLILEQQVSLASARATYEKLVIKLDADPEPAPFLKLTADDLRGLGFSRQKTRYCRLLAEAVADGSLPLQNLRRYDDEAAKAEMMKITGIGHWTADVYLMEALGRPDVWPVGDLALAVGAEKIKKLKARPNADELQELGEQWRPYRAVAARILWHYYLSVIRPPPGGKPS
ncbi:MAG: DNA-3-methyladenine glycosylase 2 family protein [Alphaproteobacteria bacterium]|nr:DNA-3-methyladenine glycosylase 2 family protein [Alphaproteobacteria bacterium]